MPTIYGEGSRAFRRLQEEIMRASTDHTIFAWHGGGTSSGMLAESPDQFLSPVYHPVDYEEYAEAFDISQPKPDFTLTNFGLYIQLPITEIPRYPGYYYGFLACSTPNEKNIASRDGREWAVVYLYRRPRSQMRRFTRTSFRGCWVGNGRAPNQEFDIIPLFLLPYEDIWPLSWQQLIEEPKLPSAFGPFNAECTVTFILAKGHQNIDIVDACPGNCFTTRNEISLNTRQGDWAMKVESGGFALPPFKLPWMGGRVEILELSFLREKYSSRISTFIVNNGMIGGRMLIVLVMGRGSWFIFLSKAREDLNASDYREGLLVSAESDPNPRLTHHLTTSGFVAVGVPFDSESNSAQLGRYLVQIERQVRLGYDNLAFRITVGLRTFETSKKIFNVTSGSVVGTLSFGAINIGRVSFN